MSENKSKYTLAQLAAIYTVYKDLSPTTYTVNCCTCGKSISITSFEDCFAVFGHYIPRSINKNLIFYPKNIHAQCAQCNVFNNSTDINKKYDEYMKYRYGENIKNELQKVENKSDEFYKDWYINEILKLSGIFPELLDILVDKDTGEVLENIKNENKTEKQFFTFSPTYKSDLDKLCKIMKTDFVEYGRF